MQEPTARRVTFAFGCWTLLLALIGCSRPVACDTAALLGLRVAVRDARTEEILTKRATAIARDGEFKEALGYSGDSLTGAAERPGVYDVTVSSPGYQTWRRDAIEVVKDGCHVRPVSLLADLEKEAE